MATMEKTCHARRAIVMAVFSAVPLLRPGRAPHIVARAACNPLGAWAWPNPTAPLRAPRGAHVVI